jgi:sarcosine oxidase subunit alpha
MSNLASWRAVARTPLHHWHAAHGARFIDRHGWQVVAAYTTAEREAEAARAGLALADISASAKLSLRGSGVPDFIPALLPHRVAAPPGTAALACRLAEDHLLIFGSVPLKVSFQGLRLVATDTTSAYAGLWVIGPRCQELLRRLTLLDVRVEVFPVNSCAETQLAGVEALLVATSELSLPSLRVYVAWDLAEYVWERMLQAGRDGNVTPIGHEALGLLGSASAL